MSTRRERTTPKPKPAQDQIVVNVTPQTVTLPALVEERQLVERLMLPSKVTTASEYAYVTESLVGMRKARKAFENKQTELLKPLKESFKKALENLERDLGLQPFIRRCKEAEEKLVALTTQWVQDERAREAKEQAEADAARRLEMANVKARGGNPLTVPERSVAPPPPKTVATGLGKVTMMKVAKWRVTDPALVPYEYEGTVLWTLNEGALTMLRRKAGTAEGVVSPIPGIEFYTDETPSVR